MPDPQPLGKAISELIALRGLARKRANTQLADIWRAVAGDQIADQTHVLGIKRRMLLVAVRNAPLLNELVSFHRRQLLKTLQADHPKLNLRGIKFELRGTTDGST